jgi:hypothetical protein
MTIKTLVLLVTFKKSMACWKRGWIWIPESSGSSHMTISEAFSVQGLCTRLKRLRTIHASAPSSAGVLVACHCYSMGQVPAGLTQPENAAAGLLV